MAGGRGRNRNALIALALAAVMTAGLFVMGPYPFGVDAAGIAFGVLANLAIGFLVIWALLILNVKLVAWWRGRHPLPALAFPTVEPGATVPPFRWSGRAVRHAWGILGFAAFYVAMTLIVVTDQRPGTTVGNFALAMILLVGISVALALAFALRKRTVVIDASGIAVERGMRSDIHAHWGEVQEIGIAKFPFAEWAAPFSVMPLPKMIVLRGKDGGPIGILQPAGEAPPGVSEQIELAVRAQAVANRIPVRDLGFQEMATWKKPKRPPLLTVRSG